MAKPDFNHIRNLIIKGKVQKALDELFQVLEHSSSMHGQLRDDIVLLRTRLNEVNRNENLNLISQEVASRERAQLHHGILDVINQLEKPSLAPAVRPGSSWPRRRDWSIILGGVLIAFGLLLFFYGRPDGGARGELYVPAEDDQLVLHETLSGLRSSWSMVVPGNFVGNQYEDLFCYDPSGGKEGQGLGVFYQSDGLGTFTLVHQLTDLSPNLNIITPGNFDGKGHTDLYFFDARIGRESKGVGETYVSDGSGHLELIGKTTNLRQTWDIILADNFNGDAIDDLLFFDSKSPEADGRSIFVAYRSNGSGDFGKLSGIVKLPFNGEHLVSGYFDKDGIADLFFYSNSEGPEGTGLFYYTTEKGKMVASDTLREMGASWERLLPVNLDSDLQTELLCIGPQEEEGKGIAQLHWNVEDDPAIRWQWYTDFPATQRLIVPGKYLEGYLAGLFCYGGGV